MKPRFSIFDLRFSIARVAMVLLAVTLSAEAQTLTTWTDANLAAWWAEHPDPASWKAGKAELLAALREALTRETADAPRKISTDDHTPHAA